MFYHGVDRRNGVGVVLKEKHVNNVMEVRRVSGSICLKTETDGILMNAIRGYVLTWGVNERKRLSSGRK